ncbi:type II toxin-antitoxin system VapC family toxin [Thauera sp. 2A1]|uniref:type II toxin-antitoxin system VapC family toxin n=1 Tax=Thauera sp. 2A1 TaxID=2570191 RepID=UPI0012926E1F|nr:type II toxin-antitoxin system VapC family toxin [Thauera sp. 2A1]KAI5915166.1 type II toxin-antitoxin system VapC family toxin [Thauera sp. 2A1]
MTKVVLDASAVLALLNAEPGANEVESVLGQAVISTVNVTEVFSRLLDWGMSPAEVEAVFAALDLEQQAFDSVLCRRAAWLRSATRASGLSLGDRACLALAQSLAAPVLTTDRAWLAVAGELQIDVRVIRPDSR